MKIFNTNKNEFHWDVLCKDGQHHICVKKLKGPEKKVDLYLDKRRVETITYQNNLLSPLTEYHFACEEERLTLVIYQDKMNIAYNGKLIERNMEYDPKDKLPIFYQIAVAIFSILSFALMYVTGVTFDNTALNILAIGMPLCCAVIAFANTTSPFLKKSKKYLYSLLAVAWSWILEFLVIFVFYGIQHWL